MQAQVAIGDHDKDRFEADENDMPHISPGKGVLPCISAIFESAPGDVTQQCIYRAVTVLISHPKWRCQEAVRLGLIPAADDRFSSYTESERLFLRHSTLHDWTQAQTQETLKLLRDPAFKTEDLASDVLRKVSVIEFGLN